MSTTIQQSITFAGIQPEELFDSYLDPTRHAALLGAAVSITAQPGTPFWVFAPDAVRGLTLFIHPRVVIAQSWRAQVWADSDPDSVLTLLFEPDRSGGTRLQLTQAGVPSHAHEIISAGWHERYWQPWQANLGRQRATTHEPAGITANGANA
jgi:activator of HSP90 ATPase